MRRTLRLVLWFSLAGLLLLAGAALVLYRGTQHVPEFYRQALSPQGSLAEQVQRGDDLERKALALRNAAIKPGAWRAEFSDAEVNGWLAAILPQNHPGNLPAEVREPRVKLDDGSVRLGWRLDGPRFQAVISLQAELYLTDQPNQIAIRLQAVRAGWVPVPLTPFLEEVSDAARRAGVDLSWSQQDGDPVALLRVPAQHPKYPARELRLDALELSDGKLTVAGHTERRG